MQQKKPLNIKLEDTTPYVCEHCGSETFREGLFLRKISRFLTGEPQDTFQPIPTFICAECGKVGKEFSLVTKPTQEEDNV
jgi:DNA-directed RNA polymerase subunit RPC12/RpoP